MANENSKLEIELSAKDSASPTLDDVNKKLDELNAELKKQNETVKENSKDWLDYSENISRITAEVAAAGASLAAMRFTMLQFTATKAIFDSVTDTIARLGGVVGKLGESYQVVKVAVANAAATIADTSASGWGAVQIQTERLETKLASLTARFLEFGRIASVLERASIGLAILQIGIAADESNEKTRLLTEQIGGLTTSLQELDQKSEPVKIAKERFEELYKASLALARPIEDLLPLYKEFFDQTDDGSRSIKENGQALTDFLSVMRGLRASSTETADAQKNITAAFEAGTTSVSQLGTIFGTALTPALEMLSATMNISVASLKEMIDTGRIGTEDIFPALAAASRQVTDELSSAGEAAQFSTGGFDRMGQSFYDLANSKLPGVTNALQYTQKEIASTVNASVDPIGAAVEQIENLGLRIAEWARLTKQKLADISKEIVDLFAGPGMGGALTTGMQEAMYALDLILVSAGSAITATAESIGILAGAATTATNPIDALNETWLRSADEINNSRNQLQAYIDALEGTSNAAGRTAEETKKLAEAAKTLPTVNLPTALQDIIDKLTTTQKASEQVDKIWNQLKGLDFTGTNIQGLLILRQTIEEVSAKTKDALGTQEVFAKALAGIPTAQFDALLAKVTALKPQLQEAGDKGLLFGTVIAASFQKIIDAAAKASDRMVVYNESVKEILALDSKRAENSELITNALNKQAAALQTVAEKAAAETTILQAAAEKAALQAQTAQAIAASKQAQADASRAVYVNLIQELNGVTALTAAEKEGLAAAKEDADQKAILAAQSREVTIAAQLEAAQLAGVAQANRLNSEGTAALVGSLEELKKTYLDSGAAVEILTQNQKDGIATKDQVNAAIAEQVRALSEYNTAIDLTKKAFSQLGLDANQVLTGMDTKFRDSIQILQNLAENGKLAGDALTEALQNSIKTADSQTELKALTELIKQLGKDGKIAGNEMTLALDSVEGKLREITAAADPVEQAFARLGVNSSASLKEAAREARNAFDIIKNSGTATAGDLNAAFEVMAAKVLAAGEAAGPVGLAMAEASLRARAATEEQRLALEELIAKYEESGSVAVAAADLQVDAADRAATAIENYSTRVEAQAGAGANAFNRVTSAVQRTTVATAQYGIEQERAIQGYDDLSEAGKEWADALIRQAIAADASKAGLSLFRDETGKTIREIQDVITKETELSDQLETLEDKYDAGALSAESFISQLKQLALYLGDPITSAGESSIRTIKELLAQLQQLQNANSRQQTTATPLPGSGGGSGNVINVQVGGLIDVEPRTLEMLARKLQPYFDQIIRRSA